VNRPHQADSPYSQSTRAYPPLFIHGYIAVPGRSSRDQREQVGRLAATGRRVSDIPSLPTPRLALQACAGETPCPRPPAGARQTKEGGFSTFRLECRSDRLERSRCFVILCFFVSKPACRVTRASIFVLIQALERRSRRQVGRGVQHLVARAPRQRMNANLDKFDVWVRRDFQGKSYWLSHAVEQVDFPMRSGCAKWDPRRT